MEENSRHRFTLLITSPTNRDIALDSGDTIKGFKGAYNYYACKSGFRLKRVITASHMLTPCSSNTASAR